MKSFSRFSRGVIAYNLLVILWGAWVRITGSGAGCGSHWPMCNGEIVPRAANVATLIELSHRLTSGMSLLLTIGLCVAAFRTFQAGHAARLWTVVGVVFIFLEAAIGAGLVKLGLVAKDNSALRAIVICLHLINTLGLLASGVMSWQSAAAAPVTPGRVVPRFGWVVMGLIVVTSASGAITALGDTLFPVESSAPPLYERLQQDFGAAAHFLVRLRVVHPVIAVLTGVCVLVLGRRRPIGPWTPALDVLVFGQVFLGVMNIALHAPGWLQVVHLLVANALWIALVGWLRAAKVAEG